MKIGYVYLFGEGWQEWNKHNKPLIVLISELQTEGCDKIYIDPDIPYHPVIVADDSITEVESINFVELIENIMYGEDENILIIRGKSTATKGMNNKELMNYIENIDVIARARH